MPKLLVKSCLTLLFAILAWCMTTTPAAAGGGPENVFLVVNPSSADSLTIANHYIKLRQIPAGNVFYLPWNTKYFQTDIEIFRAQILNPIIEAIQSRRLSAQIDCIAYSCDYPYRISLDREFRKFEGPEKASVTDGSEQSQSSDQSAVPKIFTPMGSLNGLTYLWQSVIEGKLGYLDLKANRYTRVPIAEQKDMPTIGFRSSWQFGPQGELVNYQGKSYLLSAFLGVTYGRGNTVEEILRYLKRSAAADGKHPRGAIYFVQNEDVRSRSRHNLYPEAVKELEKLGVSAQIVNGIIPINKKDVQGAVIGAADFNWKTSGSTILPGAICENFTSYGGIMDPSVEQTPLSEFLRYGAAGSCGTVYEPYTIPHKFPMPMIQVHYARGCTLIEAFYQSVYEPYQLLIVGDPLCRPWANIPKVKVSGVKAGDTVKGTLTLTPTATTPSGQGIDHFELFVNGSRASMCKPRGTLTLDTALLPDGYQELRVVAVEAGLIQSQGRIVLPIVTNNYDRKIEVKVASEGVIRPDNPLIIEVNSPGSIGVTVLQNSRVVGRLPGEEGQIKIEAADLGSGPVRLQVIGLGQGGPNTHVLANPVDVTVEVPEIPKPADDKPIKENPT